MYRDHGELLPNVSAKHMLSDTIRHGALLSYFSAKHIYCQTKVDISDRFKQFGLGYVRYAAR